MRTITCRVPEQEDLGMVWPDDPMEAVFAAEVLGAWWLIKIPTWREMGGQTGWDHDRFHDPLGYGVAFYAEADPPHGAKPIAIVKRGPKCVELYTSDTGGPAPMSMWHVAKLGESGDELEARWLIAVLQAIEAGL